MASAKTQNPKQVIMVGVSSETPTKEDTEADNAEADRLTKIKEVLVLCSVYLSNHFDNRPFVLQNQAYHCSRPNIMIIL